MAESLPVAGFYLDGTLKDLWKDAVDHLISDLGRQVKLYFKPTATACPNCFSGPDGRSNGQYNSSNPNTLNGPLNKPFQSGGICPVCKGSHQILTENSRSYTSTIDPVGKDLQFVPEGISPQDVRVTEMVIGAFDDIRRCEKALIDSELYVRIRDPIKRGFQDLNYVVCYWKKMI